MVPRQKKPVQKSKKPKKAGEPIRTMPSSHEGPPRPKKAAPSSSPTMAPSKKPVQRSKKPKLASKPVRPIHPPLRIPPRPKERILELPIVPGMSRNAYQAIQAFVDRRMAEDKKELDGKAAKRKCVRQASNLEVGEQSQIPITGTPQVRRSQAHVATQNLPTPEASSPQVSVAIDFGREDNDVPDSSSSSGSESSDDNEDSGDDNVSLFPDSSDTHNLQHSPGHQLEKVVIDLTGEDSDDDNSKSALPRAMHRIAEESLMKSLNIPGMKRRDIPIFSNNPRVSEMSYQPSERLSMAPPLTPAKRKYTGINIPFSGTNHRFLEDDGNGRPADHLRPYRHPAHYRESTRASSVETFILPSIEADSGGVARRKQDGAVYDVAEIVGEHRSQGKHEFQVRWVDFEKLDWVRKDDCCCPELIIEYRKNLMREDFNFSDGESVIEVEAPRSMSVRNTPQRKAASTARFSRAVSVAGDQRVGNETCAKFDTVCQAAPPSHSTKKRRIEEHFEGPRDVHSTKEPKTNVLEFVRVRDVSYATVQASDDMKSATTQTSRHKGFRSWSTPVRVQQSQVKIVESNRALSSTETQRNPESTVRPKGIPWPFSPRKLPPLIQAQSSRTSMHPPAGSDPWAQPINALVPNTDKFGRDTSESQFLQFKPPVTPPRQNVSESQMGTSKSPSPTEVLRQPEHQLMPSMVYSLHDSRYTGPSRGFGDLARELKVSSVHQRSLPTRNSKAKDLRHLRRGVNQTPLGIRPGQSHMNRTPQTGMRYGQLLTNQAGGIIRSSNAHEQLDKKEHPRRHNNNGTRPNFEVCRNVKNELRYVNGRRQQLRGG